MISIKQSVGEKGKNHWVDVLEIQNLLNDNRYLLGATQYIPENGTIDPQTINAIMLFQEIVMRSPNPDGRVDPRGKTLHLLNTKALKSSDSRFDTCPILATKDNLYPLLSEATKNYKTGMRRFGSSRSNGKRLHAGCDLYAKAGSPIRAMNDGIVMRPVEFFYMGTRVLTIKHNNFIARYGEISHAAEGIENGTQVKKGQIIGYVGVLKFKSGNVMSMLHLELYSGTMSGPLSVSGTKYKRRGDLIDPTSILDASTKNFQTLVKEN